MKVIHQNSEKINYPQNRMNIQEENNFILYNKQNTDLPHQHFQSKEQAYYNNNINAHGLHVSQSTMEINEPGIMKTKLPANTDISARVGTYRYMFKDIGTGACKDTYTDTRTETAVTTQETLSRYIPTNENLNLSHQFLDMYNQNIINSKETIGNECFESMDKIHEQHKYNTNKQLIENESNQHSYYYNNNTFEYLDLEKTKLGLNNTDRQQKNTYQDMTNDGNYIFPIDSQQAISENIQESLPSIHKNNMYSTTTLLTAPTNFQRNMIHELQTQEEQQQEAIIDMQHKRKKTEEEAINIDEPENQETMKQEICRNSYRQIEYPLQKSEDNCYFSQDTHEEQNIYDLRESSGNMNYQLGINEQELAAFYAHHEEQNKQNNSSVNESYDNKPQEHFYKQNDFHGNNGHMVNQPHDLNSYSNTAQHDEESYNQYGRIAKYTQNSTAISTYEHDSAIIKQKEESNNNNINNNNNNNNTNDEKETSLMETNTKRSDGIMKIRTVRVKAESLNISHSLLHQQQQKRNINGFPEYNINQNRRDILNAQQEQYFVQNTNNYNNIPIESNINANRQTPRNTTNTLLMSSTANMQSQLNELNSMPRMNYNSLMFKHSQGFNQKQASNALTEEACINMHMDEPYHAKDIREFMLEPKLYTKMDLDMPEVVDGLTTLKGNDEETEVKKESVLKYKDTWRLIPGKSFNISQNGNTNQTESNIQLFQQYLDRSNEKTQQMLLNSSFNSLTGQLTVHPIVNDQEVNNASTIYSYKDPAAAFPNPHFQMTNSLANDKPLPNTLYSTAIDEVNNGQEWKLYGTKQFLSTNELRNVHGRNHVKELNKLTGADKFNAINNIDAMPMNIANDSHFPIDIPTTTDFPLNATTDMSKEKQLQQPMQSYKKRTQKQPAIPLCGNTFSYDLKSYISKTLKNYFKGKQTN